jgi:hypothetical protein
MEVNDKLHVPAALLPGKRAPRVYWIGIWAVPRALHYEEKRKYFSLARKEHKPWRSLSSFLYSFIFLRSSL